MFKNIVAVDAVTRRTCRWAWSSAATVLLLMLVSLPVAAVNIAWETHTDGGVGDPNTIMEAAAVTPDGGLVAVGSHSDDYLSSASTGFLAVSRNSAGEFRWSARLDVERAANTAPLLQIRPDGDVFVAIAGHGRWIVVRFDGGTGERRWLRSIDHPAWLSEYDGQLAISATGNPVLASVTTAVGNTAYWRVRQLSGADGSDGWDMQWPSGPISPNDELLGLSAHPGGDVIVSGSATLQSDPNQETTVATLRLSGDDGAVVWEHHESGTAFGAAMATDSNGNTVLLNTDWSVTWIADDGTPRWRIALPELDHAQNERALAVGADGSPVVVAMDPDSRTSVIYLQAEDGAIRSLVPLPPVQGLTIGTLSDIDVAAGGRVFIASRHHRSSTGERLTWLRSVSEGAGPTHWSAMVPLPRYDTPLFTGVVPGRLADVYLYNPAQTEVGAGDFRLDRFAADSGAHLWTRSEISEQMSETIACATGSPRPRYAAMLSDGSTVLTSCQRLDALTVAVAIIKVSADGALAWSTSLSGQDPADMRPAVLAVDADDQIHIAYLHSIQDNNAMLGVARLSGESGVILQQDSVLAKVSTVASIGLVLDGPDDRYLSWREPAVSGSAVMLARYDLSEGTLLWQQPIWSMDVQSQALSLFGLDQAGNPILGGGRVATGSSVVAPLLQVYSRDDGSLLWEDFDTSVRGNVQAIVLAEDGSLMAGRGSGINIGISFARHAADGETMWRTAELVPPERAGALVRAMVRCCDDGDICFAGGSRTGFPHVYGNTLTGRVRGSDGHMLWLNHNESFGAGFEASAILLRAPDVLRTAGFDVDSVGLAQSVIVDYDAATGARLAIHPMGGRSNHRLLDAGDGSYRFGDDAFLLEGSRVRVRSLNDVEQIFASGFELPAE